MDGSSSLRAAFVAVALTVVGVRSDSTSARVPGPGYGGVLPVPVMTDAAGDSIDPIAIRHVTGLIERGRVLYAAGHAPKPVDRATASAHTRRVCPQQLVQNRGAQVPTT